MGRVLWLREASGGRDGAGTVGYDKRNIENSLC